ncbi:MAG: hypothetical protein R3B49_00170 [Phycisphaerales bacterium]
MGTLFLVLQMVLGQLGGHDGSSADGGGFDVDHGGDFGGHDGDFDHADHSGEHAGHDADAPGHEFRMLSLQSIAAFAMGSWVGLAAYQALHWSFGASVLAALGAGVGIAWMMVTMLRQMLKLQSSGNIVIGDAVGEHGTVVYVADLAGRAGSGRVVVARKAQPRVQRGAGRHGVHRVAHERAGRGRGPERECAAGGAGVSRAGKRGTLRMN